MTDVFTASERSKIMSKIKGANTGPERIVRSVLHRMGYRFSLNSPRLPGRPDITLTKHRTVVFVHGCFWHSHRGCPRATRPKTRIDSWEAKLDANKKRDSKVQRLLVRLGWRVLIVWQCETNDRARLANRLNRLINRMGGRDDKTLKAR